MIAISIAGWLLAGACAAMGLAQRHRLMLWREAIARACHELRGPLAAARLGLQLGLRGGEPSAARLRAIDLELSRAALALDDLASADGRSGLQRLLEEVDLGELVSDSVEAWRGAAAARGIDLVFTGTGPAAAIEGDRVRLAQATGNLIANAIEHGEGPVEVRCRVEEERIRIEVTDTGPGLPAPVAELTRRAAGGRGARGRGLAIADRIATEHGGRLAAAPSQRGARLVLELPAPGAPVRTPAAG